MSECICEWPDGCARLGVIYCEGCGGDQCVCGSCTGEMECPGCDECPDWDDEEPDDCDEEDD